MSPELNPITILLLMLTACAVTIAGMAGVIKLMLFDKIKEQGLDIKHLMKLREEDSGKFHNLKVDHVELAGKVEALTGRVYVVEDRCGISTSRNGTNGDRRACERGEG